MSGLAERLRGIVRPPARVESGDGGPAESAPPARSDRARAEAAVADALGGEWQEGRGQRYLVVDRAYAPGYRHGRMAMMDGMPPWPSLPLLAPDVAGGDTLHRLLFVDLETTGLAGGAGTYAFLVGCGWFDGPTFRVRQFFLSAYAGEAALLDGLARVAGEAQAVVTFNGKSFDLPLIETRFFYHRMPTPFAGLPHVDMLHPARRLWRAEADEAAGVAAGCRLTTLERALCGMRRDGDVPGFEIPGRYFQYVRTGDARPLEGVFEHNRLDLVSLALVMAQAAQLLDAGPAAARSGREALGLGRLYERAGRTGDARQAYARAAGLDPAGRLPVDVLTRAEALRAYAVLCRRERQFVDAARAWQRLVALPRCPAPLMREAIRALAVHHEHRLRDPHAARTFALQSMHFETRAAGQQAVRHRLARLERKIGSGVRECGDEARQFAMPLVADTGG